ncbi:MAG: hypothetical protein KIT84_03065 [Labilithrix sp.]|nr:hypothetical protein [Labilithrix sp.]MCW5809963.1 hypothetical protein [Labilithrix sp.]
MMKSWLGVMGLVCMIGCSSDDDADAPPASPYEPLYSVSVSSSADTTKLDGLWETAVNNGGANLLARVQFKDGKILFASRCSGDGYETVTVGITVNATWDDKSITVSDAGGQDSKTSNSSTGKPPVLCIAQLKGPGTSPYAIEDAKLETLGYTFTKVAD